MPAGKLDRPCVRLVPCGCCRSLLAARCSASTCRDHARSDKLVVADTRRGHRCGTAPATSSSLLWQYADLLLLWLLILLLWLVARLVRQTIHIPFVLIFRHFESRFPKDSSSFSIYFTHALVKWGSLRNKMRNFV